MSYKKKPKRVHEEAGGQNDSASITGKLSVRPIAFGFRDVLRPAKIAPVEFVGTEGEARLTSSGEPQIDGNDGEGAFF
jgi:hypothetical protein